MADSKISSLTELTVPSSGDLIPIVDISDTSMAGTGTDKKIQYSNLLAIMYPIGCVYISTVSTNPATLFGFGTWITHAGGRTIIGAGTSDAVYAAGATGGESTHLLTGTESGEKGHNHIQDAHAHGISPATIGNTTGSVDVTTGGSGHNYNPLSTTSSATATNQAVGASNAANAHNNLSPYVVDYAWTRTA